MVLAEPTYNFQGVLLLDAGLTLTEKNIKILKSWGVTKVRVEGEGKRKRSGDAEFENEARLAIKKGLEEKFSDIEKDPVIMEIMRVAENVLGDRLLLREDEDEKKVR